LTDECTELDIKIKKMQAELKMKKSTLAMYVEQFDLKEAVGSKGSMKVGKQNRFKCWADNKAKIMELPSKMRTELCVPDYQAIKKEVEAGNLPPEILDDALYKEVVTISFKERK
jgi:hypothetical protein